MSSRLALVCATFILIVTGCSAAPASPTPAPTAPSARADATPTATLARLQTIRMEMPLEPDISDLPRLMMRDALKEEGYTVETTDFDDNTVAVQAMTQGSLDLAFLPISTAWAAIQEGAKIVTVLDSAGDTRMLVTTSDIKKCSDLNGKQVAVPNMTGTQTLLLQAYIKKNCPEAAIEMLVISGTGNRLAALVANQLNGALLDLSNILQMERQGITNLNVLFVYSVEFPGRLGAAQVIRTEIIEKYPETVKDIIRATLAARRSIQDKTVLTEMLVKHIKMEPAEAERASQVYLDQKIWDVNGGLSEAVLQNNIDVLYEAGGLKTRLKPSQVANVEPLNAVLDEIGRK